MSLFFFFGGGGGMDFICLPSYNSKLQLFAIEPLVSRTSNLRDSTVFYFSESK